MEKSHRYFCVETIKVGDKNINLKRKTSRNDDCLGRYKGASPMAAAKKVASRVLRETTGNARKVMDITIKEITQGSKNKSYTYHLKKKTLKEPQGPFNSKYIIISVKK